MILLAVVATACGKNNKEASDEKPLTDQGVTEQAEPDTEQEEVAPSGREDKEVAEGKELISNSDCFACHKNQEKLIGPAYVEVAKKYEPTDANIQYLSDKIINGGSGVWGEVPMAPHPSISEGDSKKMVKYILSLAK